MERVPWRLFNRRERIESFAVEPCIFRCLNKQPVGAETASSLEMLIPQTDPGLIHKDRSRDFLGGAFSSHSHSPEWPSIKLPLSPDCLPLPPP
ncbi:hypothetical protein CEXT_473501 [Caerostris extrusa]|uniref:Uncharacterized protein n=1 Tax=Caerostris extrusa TaxID=172846 RepID=A0AAV4V4M2_CAEEX|nr:hypothetical protein CEXT_473501 [Caerostris extrusa]